MKLYLIYVDEVGTYGDTLMKKEKCHLETWLLIEETTKEDM